MGVLRIVDHAQHGRKRQVGTLVDFQQVDRQGILLQLQLALYVHMADDIGKQERNHCCKGCADVERNHHPAAKRVGL